MRKIFCCLLLACSVAVSAQVQRFSGKTALEEIAADKFLAAGNMTDYDRLPRQALTPTPKGYEPYYLSHYGRHGARYLWEESDYAQPVQTLQRARMAGKLTPTGEKVLAKLDSMQTQALQDKLDAARAENTRLAGEISQAQQNQVIAGMIGSAVNPLASQLAGIRSEVDAIKRCQPSTITLPNNSMTAVPTIWANAVADNIVDRINAALTPTATTPEAGA